LEGAVTWQMQHMAKAASSVRVGSAQAVERRALRCKVPRVTQPSAINKVGQLKAALQRYAARPIAPTPSVVSARASLVVDTHCVHLDSRIPMRSKFCNS
jgi:hypothetical protein